MDNYCIFVSIMKTDSYDYNFVNPTTYEGATSLCDWIGLDYKIDLFGTDYSSKVYGVAHPRWGHDIVNDRDNILLVKIKASEMYCDN